MSRKKAIVLGVLAGMVLVGCTAFGQRLVYYNKDRKLDKINRIIYFQPTVYPEIEEIKSPTNQAFFSAVTDQMKLYSKMKVIQMDNAMEYDTVDTASIKEFCVNNNAEVAIIPKVKYFKVGLGKYVFSNQVLVSLKLFDKEGNFLMETEYDTYKGNARLVGSAENSIKIGTKGAIRKMKRELTKKKLSVQEFES